MNTKEIEKKKRDVDKINFGNHVRKRKKEKLARKKGEKGLKGQCHEIFYVGFFH